MKTKLTSKQIIKKIEENREKIKEKGVKKIGLFGSFLKGKQKQKSDVDLLIEFDEPTFDNYFELWEFLEKLFKRKVDLIIEKNLRPELNYVKKETQYVRI